MYVTRGDVAGGGQITIAPMASTPVRLAFIARDGAGDTATGVTPGKNYANLREPSGSLFFTRACTHKCAMSAPSGEADFRKQLRGVAF
jgi:hypothetical protein